MNKMVYVVTVGIDAGYEGIVYEGSSKSQANHVYELWLDKGHDDVTIEEYEDFE